MINTIGIILLTLVGVIVLVDISTSVKAEYIPAGVLTFTTILASTGMYCILKG